MSDRLHDDLEQIRAAGLWRELRRIEGPVDTWVTVDGRRALLVRVDPAAQGGTVTVDVSLDGALPAGARPRRTTNSKKNDKARTTNKKRLSRKGTQKEIGIISTPRTQTKRQPIHIQIPRERNRWSPKDPHPLIT